MDWSVSFFINSILLGVGLAMDAFSVSLANGLHEPCMKKSKITLVAGIFAAFQAAMPMIGWICVHTVVQCFTAFEKMIPWIALALLGYIGGKMLLDGIRGEKCDCEGGAGASLKMLLVQGVATSIDALSVGFTIANYNLAMAIACVLLIAVVTFFICVAGVLLGKKFGMKLAGKASILGGVILIAIGIEIFISGLIG